MELVGRFSKGFLLGTGCALAGAAIFPICLVTAAMIPDCSPIAILFLQSFWSYAVAMCAVTRNTNSKKILIQGERRGVLFRGLSLMVASISSYWAIVYIPAGDVYALRFSNSIFVSLGGYLFLKEKFSKLQWLSVVGVVVGVFFVTKPSYIFGWSGSTTDSEEAWKGIILSLISCAFQTAELLFLRTTPNTPVQVKVGSSRFVLAFGCVVLMVIRSDYKFPGCRWIELVIVLVGLVCIVLSSALFDFASRYLKAGQFSLLRTSSVFFTYVYQVILLGKSLTWTSVLGASIICAFVILSTLSEVKTQPKFKTVEPLLLPVKSGQRRTITFEQIKDKELPSTAV